MSDYISSVELWDILITLIIVLISLVVMHIIYILSSRTKEIQSGGKIQSLPGGHSYGEECWCMNREGAKKFNEDKLLAYGYEVIEGEMTSKERMLSEKHNQVLKNLEESRKTFEEEIETAEGERVDLDELKEKRESEPAYHVALEEF